MKCRFSIATNASLADAPRIAHTIPSWLRVFGDCLSEIVIVFDKEPPSGRISKLHGTFAAHSDMLGVLENLEQSDPRVRVVEFAEGDKLEQLAGKWFFRGVPIRCFGGTPIMPFVQAILESQGDIVLRADCDMLFHNHGWVGAAMDILMTDMADLIEPARLGLNNDRSEISTRAFMLRPTCFSRRLLPMKAYKVDILRKLRSYVKGTPTWRPFEHMLQIEKMKGRLRHVMLEDGLGFSLHIPRHRDAMLPWFPKIVTAVETGIVPQEQIAAGWNFATEAWVPDD